MCKCSGRHTFSSLHSLCMYVVLHTIADAIRECEIALPFPSQTRSFKTVPPVVLLVLWKNSPSLAPSFLSYIFLHGWFLFLLLLLPFAYFLFFGSTTTVLQTQYQRRWRKTFVYICREYKNACHLSFSPASLPFIPHFWKQEMWRNF